MNKLIILLLVACNDNFEPVQELKWVPTGGCVWRDCLHKPPAPEDIRACNISAAGRIITRDRAFSDCMESLSYHREC